MIRYEINLPDMKLKKRKTPARAEVAETHVDACAALMRAARECRHAIVKVDGHQFGGTMRSTNNQEWRWELLPPLAIQRILREFKS